MITIPALKAGVFVGNEIIIRRIEMVLSVEGLESQLTISEGRAESDLENGVVFIKSPEKNIYARIDLENIPLIKPDGSSITVEDLQGSTDYQMPLGIEDSYVDFDYLNDKAVIKKTVKTGEIRAYFGGTGSWFVQVKCPLNLTYSSSWQSVYFIDRSAKVGGYPIMPQELGINDNYGSLLALRKTAFDINKNTKEYTYKDIEAIIEDTINYSWQSTYHKYRDLLTRNFYGYGYYPRTYTAPPEFFVPNYENIPENQRSATWLPGVSYENSPIFLKGNGLLFNGISSCFSSQKPLIPPKNDFSLTFVFRLLERPDLAKNETPLNLFTQFLFSSESSGHGRLGLSVRSYSTPFFDEIHGVTRKGHIVKLFIGNDSNNESLHLENHLHLSSDLNIVTLYRSGGNISLSANGKIVSTPCQHSILQSGCLIGAVGKNPEKFDDQLDEFFSGIIAGIIFHSTTSEHVNIIERYANEFYGAGIAL